MTSSTSIKVPTYSCLICLELLKEQLKVYDIFFKADVIFTPLVLVFNTLLVFFKGKGRGRQVIAVARTADVVIMMLDATKGDVQR